MARVTVQKFGDALELGGFVEKMIRPTPLGFLAKDRVLEIGQNDEEAEGSCFLDEAKNFQTTAVGQMNLQQDHVGRQPLEQCPGVCAVRRFVHLAHAVQLGQERPETLTNHRGIVHHEHGEPGAEHRAHEVSPARARGVLSRWIQGERKWRCGFFLHGSAT